MDDEEAQKLAALRDALAAKRQRVADYLAKRINLTRGELHALTVAIHEESQFLSDLGAPDT